MAVTAVKTFVAGEILTASDVNALNTNILSNGQDLGWPATKSKDLAGQSLTFDVDKDTYVTAASDDVVTWTVGGADVMVLTSSALTINGNQVITTSTLNSSGFPMLFARVSTLEAQASQSESDAFFVNQLLSF